MTSTQCFLAFIFGSGEGTLAFAPASSSWMRKNGIQIRSIELFLRGGNAWERYGRPQINQVISYSINKEA